MPGSFALYALIFSRIAIGLVFAASSLGKIRSFAAFEQTVKDFQLLPVQSARAASYVFLAGEIVVPLLMLLGGNLFLLLGFLLAILLLSVFCIALILALSRRLQVPCNCFGSSQKPISRADLWRNFGFLVCAVVGIASLPVLLNTTTNISLLETTLLGMMALVFVALSVYLGEVIEVFRVS